MASAPIGSRILALLSLFAVAACEPIQDKHGNLTERGARERCGIAVAELLGSGGDTPAVPSIGGVWPKYSFLWSTTDQPLTVPSPGGTRRIGMAACTVNAFTHQVEFLQLDGQVLLPR